MHAFPARRARHFVGLSVAFSALFLGTGCLCTFEREWSAAMQCGIPCDNLAGLWEGTWESEHNGHHGTLRAIITKCSDGHYKARYHATFAVLIPYSYDTTHRATEGEGVTHFCGVEDLGCLAGGVYHTNGRADGRSFSARYKAEKDHGVYRMCRVGPCQNCTGTCGTVASDSIEPASAEPAAASPIDAAPIPPSESPEAAPAPQ